jgi:hypothetical protein
MHLSSTGSSVLTRLESFTLNHDGKNILSVTLIGKKSCEIMDITKVKYSQSIEKTDKVGVSLFKVIQNGRMDKF